MSAAFLASPFFKRFALKLGMMPPTQPQTEVTHWAVLIGADFYAAKPQDDTLQGAVNDVKAMGAFFTQWPHVKVSMLTTSRPDGEGQDIPPEDPQNQATTENVSALLEEVIRAGSLENVKHVYIHFSGHGKRNNERELCLGLYRPNSSLSPDFTTGMLREAIDKMINQGMEVTLMLDCCFSTGVKRAGHFALGQVRFLEDELDQGEEPKLDTPSPEDISEQLQSASLKVDLFFDARGYTIITACGQDEQTREVKVGNERREYILNAGQAHGVCVGDMYEVTAWKALEDAESRPEEQPDEFVVGTTRSLDSVLKLIGSPKEGDSDLRSWKAKPVGFSSRQKITVHITDSIPQADREQLRQNLSKNPVLEVSTTERPLDLPTFNVELDDGDAFRVLDGAAEPISNVPCIQKSAEDYMDSLTRTLEHLARNDDVFFKLVDAASK
ncbi:hypothetical protein CEP52_012708 [Fusarium oligoseptatum]|uniref:Peptidase C14 caspase domain-containing protein n=1 Tax=Fusarium oligoseptatum TaxID=2604345 RepID=A0A428SWW8_9HYPO|nr:hypothetical protein CEP52_012708 [Fusarium oligoseptatum]